MKIILALVLALSSCASPAFAKVDWNSPGCLYTMNASTHDLREYAINKFIPEATQNQKMLIEDLSDQDILVAIQQVECEGLSIPKALEWVGL